MTTSQNSELPPSPLTQVNPESLAELFNTPPDVLAEAPDKVDRIVAILQAEREKFLLKESEPKASAKPKKVAADLNLKIEDLDL